MDSNPPDDIFLLPAPTKQKGRLPVERRRNEPEKCRYARVWKAEEKEKERLPQCHFPYVRIPLERGQDSISDRGRLFPKEKVEVSHIYIVRQEMLRPRNRKVDP